MFKRVLFFPTGGMGDASARTRLYYFLPILEQRGIHYHIASYSYHRNVIIPKAKRRWTWQRIWLELLPLRTLFYLLFADVVWFQKLAVRSWALRLAHSLGKRIVYDLDDAVYLNPPEGEGKGAHQIKTHDEHRRIIENVLKHADAVTVSGESLAKFARQYAAEVAIIPTVVGTVANAPSVAPKPPVIVWVGAPENLRYLLAIEAVIIRLQSEFPDLVVRLITSRLQQDQPGFRYEHVPWSLAAERDVIPNSTVGVAPLADDEWCRAKMNYKALVYLAQGVPAVITPGGFPLELFEENKSILVARTPEDWYKYLKDMIESPERRQAFAQAGMDVLRKKLMATAWADEFCSALSDGSKEKRNNVREEV